MDQISRKCEDGKKSFSSGDEVPSVYVFPKAQSHISRPRCSTRVRMAALPPSICTHCLIHWGRMFPLSPKSALEISFRVFLASRKCNAVPWSASYLQVKLFYYYYWSGKSKLALFPLGRKEAAAAFDCRLSRFPNFRLTFSPPVGPVFDIHGQDLIIT